MQSCYEMGASCLGLAGFEGVFLNNIFPHPPIEE